MDSAARPEPLASVPSDDRRLPSEAESTTPSTPGSPAAEAGDADGASPWRPGMEVRLRQRPGLLKTAGAMPMLRPPDLVDAGEVGQVVALRPMGVLAVKFRRGTFLLVADLLEAP